MLDRNLSCAAPARIALAFFAVGFLPLAAGCTRNPRNADITTAQARFAVMDRQSTPTEIQSRVMAFADKYAARAAQTFDDVHAQATTMRVRVYAREAKVSAGFGAVTIAAEVNPVASMLDMLTMVRLKRKSFEDHGAPLLPEDLAQQVREMHGRSEREAWVMAAPFLTGDQMDQLRAVIDRWYEQNADLRAAAHLRLLDFASFRRESTLSDRSVPPNMFALFHLDPLAGMDPVQREINESRLFAERTLFVAKRFPFMAYWQVQLAAADFFATPEVQGLLTNTEQATAAADRIAATSEHFVKTCARFTEACERFVTTWEGLPDEVGRVAGATLEDMQKRLALERAATIEQTTEAIDLQRKALLRDVNELEGGARAVIADVNQTLAEARATANALSASTKEAVASANLGMNDVVDHAYRRLLTLLVVALVGIPVVMLIYRLAAARLIGATSSAVPARDQSRLSA